MNPDPSVRSVARAVELLRACNRQPVATIDFLFEQTGIPKPSIVRLLQTLEACGLVRHAPQRGAYFLTSGVRSLSSGYHSEPMIVEAAAPLLDALTLRVKWPVALAVLDDIAMVVRYSTIPLSPLARWHSTLNTRLSLVSRAIGRAYLAYCSPEQQDALLKALAESRSPEDAEARDAVAMRSVWREVRRQGHAMPATGFWPASNTIAVPVFDNHGVACSFGLTYFTSTMTPAQAVKRYLVELQDVARQIGERLKVLQAAPPVPARSQPKARSRSSSKRSAGRLATRSASRSENLSATCSESTDIPQDGELENCD